MTFTFGKKQVLLLGGFFFLIQFIFAVIFYRERLYIDSSHYFFNTVNSGWFKIGHQRFVLVFAEILPLLGSYIGLPLKALLVLYSLNQVFFFLALFLILVRKNDLNGALTIIALLAFNEATLYVYPMLEIQYGAGFAILLFSFLRKDVFTKKDYAWIALLELTALFSHPENFILIFFFILLDIERRKVFNRMHLTLSVIFIVTGIYKYLTFDNYEVSNFDIHFHRVFSYSSLNLPGNQGIKRLAILLLRHYWILLLLLGVSCIKYGLSGKYLRGNMVFFAFAGLVALLNMVYINYNFIWYMPLISIAAVPFFYDVFGTKKERKKATVFILFVFLVGFQLYMQANATGIFTNRVNQMERIISAADKMGGTKFIVNSKNFRKPYTQISWSYPIETLLLSAERGKDKCRSIITDEDTEVVRTKIIFTDSTVFMLRRWNIIHDSELNQKYFYAQKGIYKTLDFKE